MVETLQWFATAATVIAAFITASNLGSRITGYGFCVFLVGSLAWFASGILSGQPALTWTNAILTILNIFGIWRWLGRQSKVEEGAHKAAEASEATRGETLFPVSLLTSAAVTSGGRTLGHCVDAMAGASGRLRYVMVSDGGVAGVGETLRRIDWDEAEINDDKLELDISWDQFGALEELPRDQWPAR